MNIQDLDENSLICVILFLHSDDIYPFIETCSSFNFIVKKYNNIKIKNKQKDLIPLKQPQPYNVVSSIQMIEWAKSHPGFKYCSRHSRFATRRDDFQVIKYLYKDNCHFGFYVWDEAVENENIELIKWFKSKHIIMYGYFATDKAAEVGNMKILKLLDSYDMEFNSSACDSAIYGGHMKVLKWLIEEKGLIFDRFSFAVAAETGNIQILNYLYHLSTHNMNYPWFDETVCARAAKYGQLKALKWLRKRHCNWDTSTTCCAVWKKHTKLLKWAIENNCPIYDTTFDCLEDIGLNINRNECNIVINHNR